MDEVAADGRVPGLARMPPRSASRLSMRGYLFVMVVAIVVPVLAFAALLFSRYFDSQIARIDQQLQTDARDLSLDIDRDLQAKVVTLETLATSGSVDAHDYARFYQRALRMKDLTGVDLVLRALDGQQLVNTREPFGTPLPRDPSDGDKTIIATKKPYVSNFLEGVVAHRPVYFIGVPVIEDGAVTQLLHMSVDLSGLDRFLKDDIARGQIAGILDRDNIVLARTEGGAQRLGKPALNDFISHLKGDEGTWLGDNTQGYQIRLGYARSRLSGWLVWVGEPDETIQSESCGKRSGR